MMYLVTWAIDIEADTPTEAAAQAQTIQRDFTSLATVFSVVARDGTRTEVDLSAGTASPDYLTPGERRVARALVERALAAGYSVSVIDDIGGEGETTVRRSTDAAEIMAALGTTDGDMLVFWSGVGMQVPGERRVGWVQMVWGNAEDGSELPSDYSDNPAMRALVDGAPL